MPYFALIIKFYHVKIACYDMLSPIPITHFKVEWYNVGSNNLACIEHESEQLLHIYLTRFKSQ